MKKSLSALLAVLCIFYLPGCRQTPIPPDNITPAPSTEQVSDDHVLPEQQPMFAVALPVVTDEHKADEGAVLLRSVYQNMELTVPDPEVADEVIIDFLNRIDPMTSEIDALLVQAKDAYTPGAEFTPYLSQIIFTPERLDQGILSLMGEYVVYQGSAHPEVNTLSVTYDLTSGKALSFKDILSEGVDMSALAEGVLNALDNQKDALYEGYGSTVKALLKDSENWYLSKTGLVFYFSPYEIGPYASGVITAEIPYSALTGILNDAYFPAEKDTSFGHMDVTAFDVDAMASFTQIAEVVCAQDGQKAVLYTQGLLENIQIYSPEGFTLFASAALSPGDSIILHGAAADSYTIGYDCGNETFTSTLCFSADGTPSLTT